jgi:hypothetical protein
LAAMPKRHTKSRVSSIISPPMTAINQNPGPVEQGPRRNFWMSLTLLQWLGISEGVPCAS